MDVKDFPRPPSDNGRGLHGSASTGWSGGNEGHDYWISTLVAMGIKWFKVLDDGGDSLALCERLLAAGIFPIVRIIRKDPPPNDLPEPNPGHISSVEEATIKRLIAAGVRYFETNNEPNLGAEWKHNAMPGDPIEAAKLVALNWLFDARLILEMGGLPGLPAISIGGEMDLQAALVSLGRQDILLEGCWIAVHNYCLNHPLGYPDDPVNRTGQPLAPEQYDQGPFTQWTWANNDYGRVDTLDQINSERALCKNPTQTILQDHSCFREFEYYNNLAMKYLGRSIPIISTEGGLLIGRREDSRYPRITPAAHCDQTVAMYDFMQRQAPDYYFAATPWLLLESAGWETDAWNSSFWQRALKDGSNGRNGIPQIAVRDASLADHLPVIEAVKAMPNLARRLPGTQPTPPIQPPVTQPAQPAQQPVVVTPPPLVEPEERTEEVITPVPIQPVQSKYTVKPGDTLSKIAKQFGTNWQAIATLNQIAAPNLIHPGQVLLIPTAPPRLPAVKKTKAAPEIPLPPPPTITEPRYVEAPTPAPLPPYIPPPPREVQGGEVARSATPPVVSPAMIFSSLPVPPLDWDPRLDALKVKFEPCQISPSQFYWKLISAEYRGPDESDGKHHIYYVVQDEQGKPVEYQRVWQGWPDDKTDATTNDQGEANIPLWASYSPDRGEAGPYFAWVDGSPSDRVIGMGLPLKRQVCFVLTWRRVIA